MWTERYVGAAKLVLIFFIVASKINGNKYETTTHMIFVRSSYFFPSHSCVALSFEMQDSEWSSSDERIRCAPPWAKTNTDIIIIHAWMRSMWNCKYWYSWHIHRQIRTNHEMCTLKHKNHSQTKRNENRRKDRSVWVLGKQLATRLSSLCVCANLYVSEKRQTNETR